MAAWQRPVASVLGVLAGVVGAYHGYNETVQGSTPTNGVFINAIGPPCQGSSCFPAMTVVPDFLWTGVLAIVVSIVVLGWSAAFVNRPRGGLVLVVLSVVLLLVGGGFLPPALGIVAGFVGMRIKRAG